MKSLIYHSYFVDFYNFICDNVPLMHHFKEPEELISRIESNKYLKFIYLNDAGMIFCLCVILSLPLIDLPYGLALFFLSLFISGLLTGFLPGVIEAWEAIWCSFLLYVFNFFLIPTPYHLKQYDENSNYTIIDFYKNMKKRFTMNSKEKKQKKMEIFAIKSLNKKTDYYKNIQHHSNTHNHNNYHYFGGGRS